MNEHYSAGGILHNTAVNWTAYVKCEEKYRESRF